MKIRFRNTAKSNFYASARIAVDNYFTENNISKTGNAALWIKFFIILSSFFALYFSIVFLEIALYAKLIMAMLLGIVTALIGLNICHDAIHGSISANPKINRIFANLFNVVGANDYVWHITHNIVHHTYTNIKGADEDLEIAPGLIRIHDSEELKPIHKYQHIYAFLLYGLASLSWVFRKDFVKFFQKNFGSYENPKPPKEEVFKLFFFKTLYYVMFIVVPVIIMDIAWWQFIIGFVLMHIAEGYTLALVFHPAHVVENAEFPEPDENGNIEEEWAAHQMRTTANFSASSKIACWLTGGLNMQIEHHLFPNISHIHYPKIASIVKETAEKHNIPYRENKTFFKALAAHYSLLKHFGYEQIKNPKAQSAL
jgi:linoleoyl-CoA desaturase